MIDKQNLITAADHDPEVLKVLNTFAETRNHRDNLKAELEAVQHDLDHMRHEIEKLQHENAVIQAQLENATRQRDFFMGRVVEAMTHFQLVQSAANNAVKAFDAASRGAASPPNNGATKVESGVRSLTPEDVMSMVNQARQSQ